MEIIPVRNKNQRFLCPQENLSITNVKTNKQITPRAIKSPLFGCNELPAMKLQWRVLFL